MTQLPGFPVATMICQARPNDAPHYVDQSPSGKKWCLVNTPYDLLLATLIAFMTTTGCDRTESGPQTEGESITEASSTAGDLMINIGGADFNVLLVSVDTTRADHLACYGHPDAKTPNIDRFAREGTLFKNCISSAPLTLPSHSSMLTGSYPFVHGARDNGIFTLVDDNRTLAEIFKEAGVATHAEVAALVLNRKYGLAQGFDSFGDLGGETPRPSMSIQDFQKQVSEEAEADVEIESEDAQPETDRKADDITAKGIALLTEKAESNERFFIFLHYFDPHWPHEAPERLAKQFNDDGYLAEIAFFDEQFGKLINAVQELGLAEKTLIILTSDHGEGRGEHGEQTHSVFLYDSTLHVPLIFWCPGQVTPGQVVETQVRLVDIASSIVDFARLERTPQMQGESLWPLLVNPSQSESRLCYADSMVPKNSLNYSPLRALRTNDWKYVLAPRPELYNLNEDPKELFNLAELEPQRTADMKEQLRAIIANSPEPAAGGGVMQALDPEEARKLAALGYVSTTTMSDEPASRDELDFFEPVGINPRDRIEIVDCWAKGQGLLRVGEYELAERMFRRYVQLEPDNPTANANLAKSVMKQERYEEAIPFIRTAVEHNPEDFDNLRILGNLLTRTKQYKEAAEIYQQVIELNPQDTAARVNLGNILASRRRLAAALEQYDKAVEIAPNNAVIHFRRGIALRVAGKTDQAISSLNEALRLDPTHEGAHNQLALALHQSGNTAKAIEHLEQILEQSPDQPLIHHRLGELQNVIGDDEKALASFRNVVELLPDSPVAHGNLGGALLGRGDHDEALQHLRRAVELQPDGASAVHDLAFALETIGETEEAIATYSKLIESTPKYAPAYVPASNLLAQRGEVAAAVELLRQGNQLMPRIGELANALAWYLATSPNEEIRNGNEAVNLLEPVKKAGQKLDAATLDTLAAAYAEVERFDEAVATADEAMELAREANDEPLAARILDRRNLYERGEPYREQ